MTEDLCVSPGLKFFVCKSTLSALNSSCVFLLGGGRGGGYVVVVTNGKRRPKNGA